MTADIVPPPPPPTFTEVMIDLETLSLQPNALILSIGAVRFGPTGLGPEFSVVVAIDDYKKYKSSFDIDPGTVSWWLMQDLRARGALNRSLWTSLDLALFQLNLFLKGAPVTGVWGNGAAFDNVVLRNAYTVIRPDDDPWSYKLDRCYRTLRSFAPHLTPPNSGTAHVAVDDARSQALHTVRIMRFLGLWPSYEEPVPVAPGAVG